MEKHIFLFILDQNKLKYFRTNSGLKKRKFGRTYIPIYLRLKDKLKYFRTKSGLSIENTLFNSKISNDYIRNNNDKTYIRKQQNIMLRHLLNVLDNYPYLSTKNMENRNNNIRRKKYIYDWFPISTKFNKSIQDNLDEIFYKLNRYFGRNNKLYYNEKTYGTLTYFSKISNIIESGFERVDSNIYTSNYLGYIELDKPNKWSHLFELIIRRLRGWDDCIDKRTHEYYTRQKNIELGLLKKYNISLEQNNFSNINKEEFVKKFIEIVKWGKQDLGGDISNNGYETMFPYLYPKNKRKQLILGQSIEIRDYKLYYPRKYRLLEMQDPEKNKNSKRSLLGYNKPCNPLIEWTPLLNILMFHIL